MELILVLVIFAAGFAVGNLQACERGGCFLHGRNYKVKALRGGEADRG
jgi:hypothetical protein